MNHELWSNAAPLVAGEEPPLAAHLLTPRRGYLHHGLYAGDGRVIHYGGLAGGWRRRPVEEVSLARFARGRAVRVRGESWRRYDRPEVLRRARLRLGEDRYRLFSNNCEHFCEWCLRGYARSRQVERFRAGVLAAVAAAGRLLGCGALIRLATK